MHKSKNIEFYQKSRFGFSIAMAICTLGSCSTFTIEAKSLLSVNVGISLVTIAIILAIVETVAQIKSSKIPSIIIKDEKVKFRLVPKLKYETVSIDEIKSINIPTYEDRIYLKTSNKSYTIYIKDYSDELKREIRYEFRNMIKEI